MDVKSWTIKKAEHQWLDAFELWCWRRLLKVPWTARRSNQSILKEISPGCSLEDLILKLQYFGHLMWRADSFEKILMLGKIKGRRREGNDRGWDGWMASLTQWTWVWVNSGSWWWTGRPGVLQSTGCKELDTTEQLSWTEVRIDWFELLAVQEILKSLLQHHSLKHQFFSAQPSLWSNSYICTWFQEKHSLGYTDFEVRVMFLQYLYGLDPRWK